MARYKSVGAFLLIGGLVVVGTVWGGVTFAKSMEAELGDPLTVATAAPAERPVGDILTDAQRADLGPDVATDREGGETVATAHAAVWENQDMRLAKIPVVLTNPGDAQRRVETRLSVYSSRGEGATRLWEGTVDSGGEMAPGKSVVTYVSVQSVRDPAALRIELRRTPGEG
ncbi:hypothetical protein OTB20_25075 [Streptomyces sp. H27-H1]|uniref:hypothetical protein n=1 Tax=Streptomyces sp. H27-H1 TaxID=2996461 RepID=UPI00226FDDDB|nr:hypothetical protein [Streptomyces sp. H27-H1]MCY0929412.1 hypothetical protein [Streptomyces sp. H27-H1]